MQLVISMLRHNVYLERWQTECEIKYLIVNRYLILSAIVLRIADVTVKITICRVNSVLWPCLNEPNWTGSQYVLRIGIAFAYSYLNICRISRSIWLCREIATARSPKYCINIMSCSQTVLTLPSLQAHKQWAQKNWWLSMLECKSSSMKCKWNAKSCTVSQMQQVTLPSKHRKWIKQCST